MNLLYERRIGSFAALIDEAASMDADAGLRVLGTYEGRRCYAFVTRFGGHFTVMIYERKPGRHGALGRRLTAEELDGIRELDSMLRKVTRRKVTAFAY